MVFIYENLFFNVKIYLCSTRFIFVVVGFPVNAIAKLRSEIASRRHICDKKMKVTTDTKTCH